MSDLEDLIDVSLNGNASEMVQKLRELHTENQRLKESVESLRYWAVAMNHIANVGSIEKDAMDVIWQAVDEGWPDAKLEHELTRWYGEPSNYPYTEDGAPQ